MKDVLLAKLSQLRKRTDVLLLCLVICYAFGHELLGLIPKFSSYYYTGSWGEFSSGWLTLLSFVVGFSVRFVIGCFVAWVIWEMIEGSLSGKTKDTVEKGSDEN